MIVLYECCPAPSKLGINQNHSFRGVLLTLCSQYNDTTEVFRFKKRCGFNGSHTAAVAAVLVTALVSADGEMTGKCPFFCRKFCKGETTLIVTSQTDT